MSKTAVKKRRSQLSLSNVRLRSTGQKDFLKFDTVKISANRTLVFYNEQRQDSGGNKKSLENLEKGAAGDYNGDMSRATRSYTQQILNNWMMSIQADKHRTGVKVHKHFPRCVTLTLADEQRHSDNWIKQHYLKPFIKRMHRKYGVRFWFWKAEAQANGNIHFHLVMDHYIDRKDLQKNWNEIQSDYVESYYRKKEAEGIIAKPPPSTHIEYIRSWKAWADYVTKYATKASEEGRRKIEGRIWGCSKELKALKNLKLSINETARYQLEDQLQQIQGYKLDFYRIEDHCTVVKLSDLAWKLCGPLRRQLADHYQEQYNLLYQGKIEPDNLQLQRKNERGKRYKAVEQFKRTNFVLQSSIYNTYV